MRDDARTDGAKVPLNVHHVGLGTETRSPPLDTSRVTACLEDIRIPIEVRAHLGGERLDLGSGKGGEKCEADTLRQHIQPTDHRQVRVDLYLRHVHHRIQGQQLKRRPERQRNQQQHQCFRCQHHARLCRGLSSSCEQNTHSYCMYRCAHCVSTSHCTV